MGQIDWTDPNKPIITLTKEDLDNMKYPIMGRDEPPFNVSGAMKSSTYQQFVEDMQADTALQEIPQHEPGAKLDKGKADMSLILMFGKALTEVARVGTAGAKKYTRGGWQTVPDGVNRYTAAMLRHLAKEHYETLDTDKELCKFDDGIMHAAQVAWNALARLELMLRESNEQK